MGWDAMAGLARILTDGGDGVRGEGTRLVFALIEPVRERDDAAGYSDEEAEHQECVALGRAALEAVINDRADASADKPEKES